MTVFGCFTISMDVKRQLVLNCHKCGFRKIVFFCRLQNENITKLFIHRTIKRYKERGITDIQKKIGRKKSVCTKKLHKCVRGQMRRNCQRSSKQLIQEHISKLRSMWKSAWEWHLSKNAADMVRQSKTCEIESKTAKGGCAGTQTQILYFQMNVLSSHHRVSKHNRLCVRPVDKWCPKS